MIQLSTGKVKDKETGKIIVKKCNLSQEQVTATLSHQKLLMRAGLDFWK